MSAPDWLEAANERLAPDEVHVWCVAAAELDATALAACTAIESDAERRRRMRLRHEDDRRQRLVGTALARATLSRYSDVAAPDWRFERNRHGRPEPVVGQTELPLRFNLSHAGGLVVCGVTLARDVGVDVESLDRRGQPLAIADRYFSADELRELQQLPEPERQRRFLEYWTLRESYVKARGLGIAVALRKLSFRLADRDIAVRLDDDLDDDPTDWHFELFRPTLTHVLAVAARRIGRGQPSIRLRSA